MGQTCCNKTSVVEDDYDPTSDAKRVSKILTHEALAEHLTKKKGVVIDLSLIETILLEEEDEDIDDAPEIKTMQRSSDRKGTGYVTQRQLESATTKVGFTASDAESAGDIGQDASKRIKGRKGTGAVTKEQLIAMMDDLSEDDVEVEVAKAAPKPAEAKQIDTRNKGRKGTGFVTKKKLAKLIDQIGD